MFHYFFVFLDKKLNMTRISKDLLKHKILDIIEPTIISEEFYTDNSVSIFDKDIIQYADIDSLKYVELFMELEKTFNISISDNSIVNFLDNERNININKLTDFVYDFIEKH